MENTKRTEQPEVAYDGTYYSVVKGTGRRWLAVDKFNGAVLDWGSRSCMVMYASAINHNKARQEVSR
jgi:hypothetical protein